MSMAHCHDMGMPIARACLGCCSCHGWKVPFAKASFTTADDADSGCSAKAGGGHSADAPAADDEAHGLVVQGLRRLLADRAVVLFFALAFLMGIGNGCIGFLFLYLVRHLREPWPESPGGRAWGSVRSEGEGHMAASAYSSSTW